MTHKYIVHTCVFVNVRVRVIHAHPCSICAGHTLFMDTHSSGMSYIVTHMDIRMTHKDIVTSNESCLPGILIYTRISTSLVPTLDMTAHMHTHIYTHI